MAEDQYLVEVSGLLLNLSIQLAFLGVAVCFLNWQEPRCAFGTALGIRLDPANDDHFRRDA